MQGDCNSAQFGGAGNKVKQIGCDKHDEAEPVSKPGTNDCKNWFVRNHCNSSTHFHIDDNRNRAEDNRPEKTESEDGAGLHRKNNLPEVYESPQGRHDAKRNTEQFSHCGFASAFRFASISATRSRVEMRRA